MIKLCRNLFLASLLAVSVAGLAACESAPPGAKHADLTYAHLGPIALDVSRVEIATEYIPPLKSPNVEHRAPVPPYSAVRRWARDRLKARGEENVARLVIQEASITEEPLKTTGGIKGAFIQEQAARYSGRMAVMLEIRGPQGRQRAFVTARAEYATTVPEGASIADRERIWFRITEEMMKKINAELEKGIRDHFGRYLVGPPPV